VDDPAGPAEQIALEERKVVAPDFEELPMPEALTAAGAGGRAGLLVGHCQNVLAALTFGNPVRTRALGSLEIHGVDAGTAAGRHAPDVGLDADDLLEALLCKV
jgi:hypothetical protein